MSPNDIERDFQAAMLKHLLFKSKLRSALYGNLADEAPVRDPDACALGQWLRTHRAPGGPYAHLPEMNELDRVHRRIHQQANVLLDLHQAGQPDQARAGLADVERTAETLTGLLRTAEAKLRTAGA